MHKHSLTEGSVLKRLLLFALPILGANLLQALYGTVDLMVVGLFTEASEVSAVSTGSMTMQTITGIVIGLTMGCTVLLGNSIGSKDYKKASRAIGSSALLFVLVGIGFTFLIVALASPISWVMNAPEEAFSQTVRYITICGTGVICMVLFNALSGIFRGLGDSRTPLILMAISCVCNIVGDLVLVGGLSLGSAGAAIATVTAQGISVVSAFLIIRKNGFGFEIKRVCIFRTECWGWPEGQGKERIVLWNGCYVPNWIVHVCDYIHEWCLAGALLCEGRGSMSGCG